MTKAIINNLNSNLISLLHSFKIMNFFQKAKTSWTIKLGCSISLLITILLTNCAVPVAPTGGDKDETPPKLLTEFSTDNRQIRFEKQTIVLAFDEWVKLKDAFNQVVVTPPLEHRPTIERKKKTIQFQFDEREVLRDSATYIINFGDAIQDLTEGNVAEMVFVFSTGDFIDSLSVSGNVADAYTGEAVEEVIVMLYENLADSVFRTERPFYFSKTDEQGRFKIENMKSGVFKAVALVESNLNYRFDSETEQIAFLDSTIVVEGIEKVVPALDSLLLSDSLITIDSIVVDSIKNDSIVSDSLRPTNQQSRSGNQQSLSFRLFQEESRLFLMDDDAKTYGRVKLAFNRTPYDIQVSHDSIGQLTYLENKQDTTIFWYSMEADKAFNVYVKQDTVIDTVEVKSGLKAEFYEETKLKTTEKEASRLSVLPIADSFEITFNHPLFSIDETNVQLLEDSLKVPITGSFIIDSIEKRKLLIHGEFKEDMKYEVVFSPNSIVDIFGLPNADTLRRKWVMGAEGEFGSLALKVINLSPDTAYVIKLLANNEEIVQTFLTKDSSTFETSLTYLAPDTYSIEIIEDVDENGRWTTGNYDLKRQPERVQKAILEEVRANWEVNSEVELQFGRPFSKQPDGSEGGSLDTSTGGPPNSPPPRRGN